MEFPPQFPTYQPKETKIPPKGKDTQPQKEAISNLRQSSLKSPAQEKQTSFTAKRKTHEIKSEAEQSQFPNISMPPEGPCLHIDDLSCIISDKKTEQYIYMCKAPPIKNLVIGGGGAKGVAIPGVIKALEVSEITLENGAKISYRDQLSHIGGSSVGALTACMIAAGTTADEMVVSAKEKNVMDLLGPSPIKVFQKAEGLMEHIRDCSGESIEKNLALMFKPDKLTDLTKEDLFRFVSNNAGTKDYSLKRKKEIASKLFDVIKIVTSKDKSQGFITFSMLEALHEINPEKFKNLVVTATCIEIEENRDAVLKEITQKMQWVVAPKELTTITSKEIEECFLNILGPKGYAKREKDKIIHDLKGLIELLKDKNSNIFPTHSMIKSLKKLDPKKFEKITLTPTFYFNAKNTPDLDIIIACRASAALPVVLNPVLIKTQFLPSEWIPTNITKGYLTFVDGGYYDNIPTDAFENHEETLPIVYETRETEQSFYHSVKPAYKPYKTDDMIDKFICDTVAKIISGITSEKKHTLTEIEGIEKIRTDFTLRNIPLNLDLKTTDFEKAQKDQSKYMQSALKDSIIYLQQHQDEGVYYSSRDLNELLMDFVPTGKREKIDEETLQKFKSLAAKKK